MSEARNCAGKPDSRASAPVAAMRFDGLVKYDTDTGARSSFAYPSGWSGGEVAFAPRTSSRAEDDGYLVTFVADEASGASEVYLFEARDIAAGPVVRLAVPQRVPIGYHTWWVPQANPA